MIEKTQRPLIDRPRHVTKPPITVNISKPINKPVNKNSIKKSQKKRKDTTNKKILEKQLQQPISGSVSTTGEDIKVESSVKSKPPHKRKTEKSYKPSRRSTKPKKDEGSMFKQMKDKFVGKSNKEDTKDN